MGKEKRHPSWWQLLLSLPALGALAWLEVTTPMSETAHRLVEVAIVLVIFGLAALWLRANEGAMVRELDDEMVRRQAERLSAVSMEPPRVMVGSDGNGRRRSEWCWPPCPEEADRFSVGRESEGKDA